MKIEIKEEEIKENLGKYIHERKGKEIVVTTVDTSNLDDIVCFLLNDLIRIEATLSKKEKEELYNNLRESIKEHLEI